MSIEQMRAYLQELYPSERWKAWVQRMPDRQVIAVYYRKIGR